MRAAARNTAQSASVMTIPSDRVMRAGATMNHARAPFFSVFFVVIGVRAIRGGGALLSGYSREKPAASRWALAAALALLSCALSLVSWAQQPEVQFVRSWQAEKNIPFSDLSGLALRADGTVLFV